VDSASVLEVLHETRQTLEVRRPVQILETRWVEGPALFGLKRLRLLLPIGLAGQFSRRELRYIFLHELGHVRRRDLGWNWLTVLLQGVFWFNPNAFKPKRQVIDL
jgi:bla regulator protein BlaR1